MEFANATIASTGPCASPPSEEVNFFKYLIQTYFKKSVISAGFAFIKQSFSLPFWFSGKVCLCWIGPSITLELSEQQKTLESFSISDLELLQKQ